MGVVKSKLEPANVEELASETDFTEDEIKIWYKSFSKDCPNGKLSLLEFKKIYSKLFPNGNASSFAQHTFRTFDKNGDGSIDFREFLIALSVMSRGNFDTKLEWAFSLYDQDKDGHVTKEEMLAIINAIYKMVGKGDSSQATKDEISPEERVDNLFSKMDKDGDKYITAEEFKKAAIEDPSLVMVLQVGGGS